MMAMKPWRIMKLDRISGQIALLVVMSLVAIHAVITIILLINRPDPRMPARMNPDQLISLIELIGAVPAVERPRVIEDVSYAFPLLAIRPLASREMTETDTGTASADGRNRFLRARLGEGFRISMLPGADGDERMAVMLPDGETIMVKFPGDAHRPPFLGGPWTSALLFGIVCISLLSLWTARALTAPLSAFAVAARSFSLTGAPAPLPESGPEEIRAVAKAFNNMRERIVGLIDDRTRMLAAISHDLRTPITRLRLRSEFIEDRMQRDHMLRDLDQMRAMLDSVLSFLRDSRGIGAATLVDVAVAVQTICDQFSDMGHKVHYDGPGHAMARARPDDLHRAVTNLVENAVRFASQVAVRVAVADDSLTICVEDDGPGISDVRKQAMLEPFVRGDEARNMDDAAGFGLGLAITRAIVEAHGGALSLGDRLPSGLIVRIELPVKNRASDEQAA